MAGAGSASDVTLFRRTLVVAAAIGLAIALWKLVDLILLLLAAVLVAFILYKFAHFLQQRLKLPFPAAITIAVVFPTLFLVLAFTLFGRLMVDQFTILFNQLPLAWEDVQRWLHTSIVGQQILETARAGSLLPDSSRLMGMLQAFLSALATIGTSLVVVIVGGIYLAAQPRLYGKGILHFIPPKSRDCAVRIARAIADAITAWLKAQALAMLFVGVFTGIALAIVGLPAAAAIGLIACLCEFVPYLGAIVVAGPSILIGFSISTETGIWTAVAIIVVQQIQGNVVTPLIQSSVAELPPALTIFSLIAAGILLGPMGVILAVPLTVAGQALVRELLPHYMGTGGGQG